MLLYMENYVKHSHPFSPILTHSHVKLIFYYLNDHTI